MIYILNLYYFKIQNISFFAYILALMKLLMHFLFYMPNSNEYNNIISYILKIFPFFLFFFIVYNNGRFFLFFKNG